MAITVRELVTKLRVDGDSATDKLAKFGLVVNGAKAAVDILTGAIEILNDATFGFIQNQTAAITEVEKFAKVAGVGSQEFQKLAFAGRSLGIDVEDIATTFSELNLRIRDAAKEGKGPFVEALREMGISVDQLAKKSATDKMRLLLTGLQGIEGQAQRTALATAVLGDEAGEKLARLLNLSSNEFDVLISKAEEFGIVLTDKNIKAAEDYQLGLTDLTAVVEGLAKVIGSEAAPEFTKFLNETRDLVIANKELIKEKVQKFLELVIRALKSGTKDIGRWVKEIGNLVQMFLDFVNLVGDIIKGVGGIENAIRLAAAAWVTFRIAQAAALGPIGLAITALGALAIAFIDIETDAEKATKAIERFGKISDALAATEFERKDAGRKLALLVNTGGDTSKIEEALTQTRASDLGEILNIARGKLGPRARERLDRVEDRILAQRTLLQAEQREQRREEQDFEELDKNFQKFITDRDRINAVNAANARAAKEKAREAKEKAKDAKEKAKAKGPKTLTNEALQKLIVFAAQSGQSLTGLIGNRRIEGTTPPTVVVRIIKNVFNQTIDAPVTVTGIPGETAEEFVERFEEIATGVLEEAVREAVTELEPAFAR